MRDGDLKSSVIVSHMSSARGKQPRHVRCWVVHPTLMDVDSSIRQAARAGAKNTDSGLLCITFRLLKNGREAASGLCIASIFDST